jgi:hypothetical protein
VPSVLRFDGLRLVVYPNDHEPAHVHVIGRGCEALFNLNCPAGPVELRVNYTFSRRELGAVLPELGSHIATLCSAWEAIHG